MKIKAFYDDKRTATLTYVVYDPKTHDAVIIDPLLDYDPAASKVWTESVDCAVSFMQEQALTLHYILETHAHADHLSGSQMIKRHYPDAVTAIGKGITIVQEKFKKVFNLPEDFPTDGCQFDRLLEDNETISAGSLKITTLFTPGHTPACVTYQIEDALFTGDALFMPDMGTGRCDFPAGSAEDLYDSITKRIYTLPDQTRIFVGHDYKPGGRELLYETTVGEQKSKNIQLQDGISKKEYVSFRTTRDASLNAPRLLFQSVQVNVDAGRLPSPKENRVRYLKIPINIFRPDAEEDIEEIVV